MDEFTEDIFDEKKINQAIKKGKRKTMITIVFVSIFVFVVLTIVNFGISTYLSQKAFKQWDSYVRLTTPNGYISETVETAGILGGQSNYKISKDMKIKAVVIEQKQYQFGLTPFPLISRGAGGMVGISGDSWQFDYKENGWREMMFFHPEVAYEKYNNDKELINRMDGDKIYEVALSFDKPYKQSELPLYELPEMTWFWMNTYNESELKKFQQEAKEHDWSSTFIGENKALGFSTNSAVYSSVNLDDEYKDFLNHLQTSFSKEHQNVHDIMKNISIDDVEILGIVIYGTKNEIEGIIKNPIIKASSLGGVIDNY